MNPPDKPKPPMGTGAEADAEPLSQPPSYTENGFRGTLEEQEALQKVRAAFPNSVIGELEPWANSITAATGPVPTVYCAWCGTSRQAHLRDHEFVEPSASVGTTNPSVVPFQRPAKASKGRPEGDRPEESRLGSLSRADSIAAVAARPPAWRLRGILSTEDYGMLAGPKGVGKTLAMMDLAVAVCLGEPWFGRFQTEQATVLMLSSEDSMARLWARADAVARWLNRDPEELEGRLFIHPFAFSAVNDLDRLVEELGVVRPGLVLLDPAYRYMGGVRAQLFDMGAVLTPLQEACSKAGAPLLVGHHYNRKEGAQREERISGAGLFEWSRVVMTAEAQPRRDEGPVIVTFEITGNAIDPVTFVLHRTVKAEDDGPNPELAYEVAVLAEGQQAREAKLMTGAERVRAVLPTSADDALSIKEIGDLVAADSTGKGGLRHDTIRKALNRDLEGQVDSLSPGPGLESRWWRT